MCEGNEESRELAAQNEKLRRQVAELEALLRERNNSCESLNGHRTPDHAGPTPLVNAELYHQMFTDHSAVMLQIDPRSGAILGANTAAARFYGLTVETLCGMNIDEINQLPPGEVAAARSASRDLRQNYWEFTHRLGSGEIRDVAVFSVPLLMNGRTVLFSIIHDISDRNRNRQRMEQSVELLELTQRAARAGLWSWDFPTNELTWSPEFFQLFGIDPAAGASFDSWLAVLHPDDRKPAMEVIARSVQEHALLLNEYRVLLPGGRIIWIYASGSTTYDAAGNPLRMAGICIDITERKDAEKRLSESEEKLRVLIETTDTGYLILDSAGRVIDANQEYVRQSGHHALQEILGRQVSEWTAAHDLERNKTEIEKCLREGKVRNLVIDYCGHDGTVVPIEINATVVNSGNDFQIVSTCRDITGRSRLEEQLRQSQKMDAIGRLAGGVAHDFNNLLSVILSYTKFALDETPAVGALRGDLEEIQRAAERAATLTRQLLAFSRKQILQPVPLDLGEVGSGVEKMLRRIIGEDIHFRMSLTEDLGLVRADPGQIEQVLMNLAINARDAMPDGGTLSIEMSNREVAQEPLPEHGNIAPGSYVRILVSDTGCGMDEATRRNLFEPFFTTKGKDKGTGLGLSMVYGIVKQSGGSIAVSSEPGEGTRFEILLPRDLSCSAVNPKPGPVMGPSRGTETILLAEDEGALRKVASRALEAAGYRVLAAADGDQALEIARLRPEEIHLLLTDVIMPRMSGRTLSEAVLRARPTLRVLFMSGYTDSDIVRSGVLDPGTHFIGKPFTANDLLRKVRDVLDQP